MKRSSGIVLCCVVTLLALGAVMVFSVISARASALDVGTKYLLKHLLWVTFGLTGMLVLRRLDYHKFEKWIWPIAIVSGVLLVLVLVPGIGTFKNGARRWIRLEYVGFQPSEVAKIGVLIFMAWLCASRGDRMRTIRYGLLPCMAVAGLAAGLILLEPDFGTAALVGGVATLMVMAAGAPVLPLAAVGGAAAAGVSVLIVNDPTRLDRVLAFVNPWTHTGKAAYQLQHSLIALGSGGAVGRGLGGSHQKLFFLPEPDTDFIFAIVGEELGLIGTLAVLFVFVLILRHGMKISSRARDPFGALLAFGITALIALQAIIHVAVVTASMPTKGIALPFISSGGSSMVISLAAVGILLNIASQAQEDEAPAAMAAATQPPAAATEASA